MPDSRDWRLYVLKFQCGRCQEESAYGSFMSKTEQTPEALYGRLFRVECILCGWKTEKFGKAALAKPHSVELVSVDWASR
jgi:hypothetical protein